MTLRKHSSLHDAWHGRVEGQIRDCIHSHPEWFTDDPKQRARMVNSLAKRIVGEIVAAAEVATVADAVIGPCCVGGPASVLPCADEPRRGVSTGAPPREAAR